MYKGKNCWEFMNCGRQLGGINVEELGECPASQDTSFDGYNGGKNAWQNLLGCSWYFL